MHRRSPTPTRFAANRIRSVRRFHVKCIWDSPRCCNARAQFGDTSANVKSVAKSPTYVIRHVHKSGPKRTLGDVMKRTNLVSLALIAARTFTHAPDQWPNYADSRIPRTKDGKPNLTAPAPRLNGKPDISRVWQAERSPASEYDSVLGQGFTDLQPDTHDITKNFLNV